MRQSPRTIAVFKRVNTGVPRLRSQELYQRVLAMEHALPSFGERSYPATQSGGIAPNELNSRAPPQPPDTKRFRVRDTGK